MFLSFPGPVCYIVLGIFGILLWANMDASCDAFYESNHFLLYTIFHIQVLCMYVCLCARVLSVSVLTFVMCMRRYERHDVVQRHLC